MYSNSSLAWRLETVIPDCIADGAKFLKAVIDIAPEGNVVYPKGDGPSVQTHYYHAYTQISDQQLADARRLANTMDLPLVVPGR
jgi:hypothetical protein